MFTGDRKTWFVEIGGRWQCSLCSFPHSVSHKERTHDMEATRSTHIPRLKETFGACAISIFWNTSTPLDFIPECMPNADCHSMMICGIMSEVTPFL